MALENQFINVKPGDVGIIGDPIDHSLSPVIQNAAFHTWSGVFKEDGRRAPEYHTFHVRETELKEALALMQRCKMRGLNVTIPHKVAAVGLMTRLDPLASKVGAINTILSTEEGLIGYNTDGDGFGQALHYDLEFEAEKKTALVLGAGGTARVIIHKLLDIGIERVFLWNRHAERAANLAKEFSGPLSLVSDAQVEAVSNGADLIVNTTSVGLKEGDGLPAPQLSFHIGQCVFDVIYNRETKLLSDARAAGARVVGGTKMLIYQGARAFEIWTAAPAPVEVMHVALEKALRYKSSL
jgi:shikimate dehydrogenase